METPEILGHIDILRAIQEDSISVSDITAACSSSRSTVSRFLQNAEEWSLVRQHNDGYGLTAAGELFLQGYDDLDDEDQTGIISLTESQHSLVLLRAIDSHPADRAALTEESGVSRATVHRHMDKFQESKLEWTDEQDDYIELTRKGKRIVESYESFEKKVGIIEDKIEFLERFEGPLEYVSLKALAESRQVVSTMTDNQEVVREINKIDIGDAEPLYGLSQAFSAEISDEISKVPIERESELIVDRSVYAAITHPKRWRYLFDGLRRPNFRLLVLPEHITVGLGLYGNEKAVIGAYNSEHPFHVALIGENTELINWVEQTYEYYRAQANPPSTDLFRWATGT